MNRTDAQDAIAGHLAAGSRRGRLLGRREPDAATLALIMEVLDAHRLWACEYERAERDQLSTEAQNWARRCAGALNERDDAEVARARLESASATLSARLADTEAQIGRLQAERDQARAEAEELNRQLAERTAERDEAVRLARDEQAWRTAAEKHIEELSAQFPACPACGCRTPDDPDGRECGCDEGCNDGDLPPGVQVLTSQRDIAEQRLAGVQAEHAKRIAAHEETLRRYRAENDRLRELLNEAAIADSAPAPAPAPGQHQPPHPAPLRARPAPEPAAPAPAPAAVRPRASRAKAPVGQGKGAGGSMAPGAAQGGTEESGFTE